jgi:hypothetical protein
MPQEDPAVLEDLLHGAPARDEIQPPVISRPQMLPFDQLSWQKSEQIRTCPVTSESDVLDFHNAGKGEVDPLLSNLQSLISNLQLPRTTSDHHTSTREDPIHD